MKKTFPVNINGNIFYIDEDAYKLLLDYLSQLRTTFTGAEGEEIVNDIESRISEHFDERIRLGANVIVLEDVNRVIETMGRPEELSDESRPETDSQEETTDSCGSQNVPPSTALRRVRPLRSTNAFSVTYAIGCSEESLPDFRSILTGT